MIRFIFILIISIASINITLADHHDENYQRGIQHLNQGQYKKALKVFDEIISSLRIDTEKQLVAEIHFQKASAYYALEEYENAISEYKNAIALNSYSAKYYNSLGISYSELKQYNAALDAYEKAIRVSPKSAEPHYNIGLLHLKQGFFPRAITSFKDALSLDKNWVDAYDGVAEAYLKQRLLAQAEKAFTKSLQIDPNRIAANLGLGKVYAQKELFSKAETYFKKVIEIRRDSTEAYYQLAQIYIKNGHKEKAAKAMAYFKILRDTDPILEKSLRYVKINPNDPKGYNNLGIVYLTRQRYDKAVTNFKLAIKISPTLASIHYNLGLAYHKQHIRKLAIVAYNKAISIDAKLAIAHNNIAVCYSELEVDLNKALVHAQTATELAPTEANYWDTLATVYAQLGLESKALQARQKHSTLLHSEKK